jgi:hypothetical protein
MSTSDDMSDSELLTAVRGRLSAIPLAGPPDVTTIMARGRAHRHRHLVRGVTGTLAAAAGAAVAVAALAPASHPASQHASSQPDAQLAAWTVARLADGNVSVTIRQLEDPAGLQSTLRADGIPASVTFTSQQDPACQPYPGGTIPWPPQPAPALLRQVFPEPYGTLPPAQPSRGWSKAPGQGGQPPASPPAGQTVIVIDPSALPGNAGVQIEPTYGASLIGPVQVVYASQQCTGS